MKQSVILSTYVLGFLTLGSCAPSVSCPSPHDLHPCTCKRLAYGLHVVCANFEDSRELVKAFRVLRDYEVQNVLLHNLRMPDVLPADLFDGLEISELRIEKSKLRFSQPAFKGLDESLDILNVAQRSMIKSSGGFSLARLTKLTELNIKSNVLGKVSNEWLDGKIPSAHTVVLDEDEIYVVEHRAFASLKELRTISLADNRIKNISRSMLPRPADKLVKIDLSGNEIKEIPFDFFEGMPNLKELILSGNDIKTLPERTWISIWERLDRVLLLENRLVCDERLDWLRNTRWPGHVFAFCVQPSELANKALVEVYRGT